RHGTGIAVGPVRMNARGPREGRVGLASRDLGTFNRWLNLSRIRAACATGLAILILERLHPGTFDVGWTLTICVSALVFSMLGRPPARAVDRPAAMFAAQTVFDLLIVTVAIWVAASGLPALLFRSLFVLVITPVCLITVPGGLLVVAAASVAHLWLLGAEHG